MHKQLLLIQILTVQLITTSCTGYGLVYDDPHLEISADEQACLQQATSECLLESADAITDTMSDKVAQAEALAVLSRAHFELGEVDAAIRNITNVAFIPLQYNNLIEISRVAKHQALDSSALLAFADSITYQIKKPSDKIPALLLRTILAIENEGPAIGKHHLAQAIVYIQATTIEQRKSLDQQFFKILLPVLLKFEAFDEINHLIDLQMESATQFKLRVDYAIQLKIIKPDLAHQHYAKILKQWRDLDKKWQKARDQSILNAFIKVLLNFDQLDAAKKILQQQTDVVFRVSIRSILIQQLALMGQIDNAKLELIGLLREIRQRPEVTHADRTQQSAQDDFELDSLRAQAIADVALALAESGKIAEAVHFAEQIQVLMAHIQGYTLSKLALHYARQGEFNAALLTMESIYRPVNRAACLAQISALVAETGDLSRAIVIASRINRQSWRDIAFSEISIAQAKQNNIKAAMKTLESIQRSYSSVYAMAEIARTFKATQNKR